MRRLFGVLLAGVLMSPAFSFAQDAPGGQEGAGQEAAGQQQQQPAPPPKFTMDGDIALWSVAIRPDRTADYEEILSRVKEVLSKSDAPEARQQLAGWRVMRGATAMPDGNIVYTHLITPVRGADYNLLQILYASITERPEQEALFEKYKAAFAGNLSLVSGRIAVDLSR